ncbi:MAG: phage major capsid protein [Bellilinea sp.]
MEEFTVQSARMQLEAQPGRGEFEILAITAGEGNGWQFSPAVLAESLALWDGCECFIDHAWEGRSLRDLAGVCHSPRFDPARQGVRLSVKPVGPAGALLAELGRAMLAEGPRPAVGFSADLVFEAAGRQVERILRVLSVDLVLDPARGGQFLRVMNQQQLSYEPKGQSNMEENQKNPESNLERTAELIKIRNGLNDLLLETSLAAARLPAALTEHVRQQFSGLDFEPQELADAIAGSRALVSELSGAAVVQGPGRIHGMFSGEDQINAAVHDLLGAQRPSSLDGLQVQKLSGIRELYTLMTGDAEFNGGYDAKRAQFAASADLPGLLKNALNKLVVMGWQELGRSGYRWWEPVVSVQHFTSLHDITGVLVGEVTVLPSVAEGAPYTELGVDDSAEVGSWGKYGGYVGLTLEMFERDQTHKLRQYPYKLASAALRRISALVGAVFTANAGVGPVMADTYNVFNSLNHGNLGTTALDAASWEAASSAIYNQPMLVKDGGTAPRLALDARYLIVPRTLRLNAMRILYPSFEREATIFSENLQRGEMGDVITCPEMSDANDWAAAADPGLAPAVILGERFGLLPEIYISDSETSGALFTNDELRMKVRHWVSVFVADYRPLYKSNVVG